VCPLWYFAVPEVLEQVARQGVGLFEYMCDQSLRRRRRLRRATNPRARCGERLKSISAPPHAVAQVVREVCEQVKAILTRSSRRLAECRNQHGVPFEDDFSSRGLGAPGARSAQALSDASNGLA